MGNRLCMKENVTAGMVNKQKGEIGISIGGADYTLYLDTNAMVLLEQHFSTAQREVGFQEIFAKVLGGKSLTYLRAFIWASLQAHHKGMTIEQAGHLINEAGGIEAFAQVVSEAAGVSLPTESDLRALGVPPARPRAAQGTRRSRGRSTGTASTPTAAASV